MKVLVLDNYDRDGGDMKTKINLPVVVQESTRLKAIYSLNQGGKMLSLFDKKLNKEILFRNPVFQPANLGRLMRGHQGVWSGIGQDLDIAFSPVNQYLQGN